MPRWIAAWCLAAFAMGSEAWARQDLIPGSRYTSARIAGMGDTGLTMSDDVVSSLFYNPANLAKNSREFVIEPLNLAGYLNLNYLSGFGLNNVNMFNLPAWRPSSFQGYGGSAAVSFGFKYFFAGLLAQSQVAGQVGATTRYRTLYQLIPTVGAAYGLADGILKIGYSLQWVSSVIGNVSNAANGAHFNTNTQQGSFFSNTAGVTLTLPMAYLPQVSFVARNLVPLPAMGFSLLPVASPSAGLPATEPMSFDVSAAIQPKFGRGAAASFVLGYRDLTNSSGMAFIGHLSIGAELMIRDTFMLRAGYSSGYPSAGFGVRTKSMDFNFAWYTEELSSQYLGQADMRFLLQYQYHFSFGTSKTRTDR